MTEPSISLTVTKRAYTVVDTGRSARTLDMGGAACLTSIPVSPDTVM